MKLKPYLLTFLLPLYLGGCSHGPATNLPGKSQADARLKSDIIRAMNMTVPTLIGCKDTITSQSIKDTNITRPYTNNSWEEEWTVQACGKTHPVIINFTESPSSGTNYMLRLK